MLATPPGFIPLHAPQPARTTRTFVFRGDQVLVHAGDLAFPNDTELARIGLANGTRYPVGMLGDAYSCVTSVDAELAAPEGLVFSGLRALFGAIDETQLSIAGRAFQIAEWARTHRFCGVCATPTTSVAGERAFRCPACGYVAYPRISPAMMVLVRRDDHILLAKHSNRPTNRFTALAGFLEAGESIEDAIHREVFEEVGLAVKDLRYFTSQSWPFPHSLMIAFTAEYAGGNLALDASEIAEARWFGPDDDFPDIPSGVSIASALINAHKPRGHARS